MKTREALGDAYAKRSELNESVDFFIIRRRQKHRAVLTLVLLNVDIGDQPTYIFYWTQA
jgi:hypothetical protein